MTLVEDLLDDPIAFGKKYPMQPRTAPIVPGSWSKEKRSERDSFFQVRGEDRICWFRFKPTSDRLYGPGGLALDMSTYPLPGYEPMYWLPWGADQIYRTALRPSKKFASEDWRTGYGVDMFRDTVASFEDEGERNAVFNHRMQVLGDLENLRPRVFFTAAVNGCSVIVEGTEEQPIVYHGNAGSHLAGFDEADSAEVFRVLRHEKVQHMEKRYKEFSESHAKGPRGHGPFSPQPARGVNMGHYLAPVQDKNFCQWFATEVNEIAQKYVSDTKRTRYLWTSLKDLKLEEGIGTVYGIEKDGKWKFYYQKLVFVTVLRDDGVFKTEWREVANWHTVACEKFWPDGGGRFNLS